MEVAQELVLSTKRVYRPFSHEWYLMTDEYYCRCFCLEVLIDASLRLVVDDFDLVRSFVRLCFEIVFFFFFFKKL